MYFLEHSLRNSASCTSSNFRSYNSASGSYMRQWNAQLQVVNVLGLFWFFLAKEWPEDSLTSFHQHYSAKKEHNSKLPKTHLRSTTKFHWNCKNFRSCNLASETRCSVVLNLYTFGLFWFFSGRYWPENSSTSLKQSVFLAIFSKANRLIIIYSIKCRSHHSPNVVGGTSPGLACCWAREP